jgi:hypothetical protein
MSKKAAGGSITARPIKNVEGAFNPASQQFALKITDAGGDSLAVAMGSKEAAQLIGHILSLAEGASGSALPVGGAAQVEGLHPSDFGVGPGNSASEMLFGFQIGPVRFALSLPTSKWLEMCAASLASADQGDGGKSQNH